jgi:signal transduction histidine kinase
MQVQASERERIARDLHDTLLQSVQGMIMRFHGLSLRPGLDDATRQVISDTLDEAEADLTESREQVAGLRSARIVALHSAIETFAEKLRRSATCEIIVKMSGDERILERIVAEEAAKIAAEALVNAVRHAGASTITADVEYLTDRLVVRIADDGLGMPAQVLANGGRQGHFGLRGMKERAAYAGGSLDIKTGVGIGTRVILEVPAWHAYGRGSSRKWLGL